MLMEKLMVQSPAQKLADLRAEREGLGKVVGADRKALASFDAFDALMDFGVKVARQVLEEHALREILGGGIALPPTEAAVQKLALGPLVKEITGRQLPEGKKLEDRIRPRIEAVEGSARRKMAELKILWDFGGMRLERKAQIKAERKLMEKELDAELFSLAVLKAYCLDRDSMQKMMRLYYDGLESREEHGNFMERAVNVKPQGTPAELAGRLRANSEDAISFIRSAVDAEAVHEKALRAAEKDEGAAASEARKFDAAYPAEFTTREEAAEHLGKAEERLREKEAEVTKEVDGVIEGRKEAKIRDISRLSEEELQGLAAFWKKYPEGSKAQWMLAHIYFKMKRWDDALGAVDEEIRRDDEWMRFDAEMEGLRFKMEICKSAGPPYEKEMEETERKLADVRAVKSGAPLRAARL